MTCNHIQALDLAREGKWDGAHSIVQEYSDRYSCLIHGYLHRVEGDLDNARYWYRRADEAMPTNDTNDELVRLYQLLAD